MKRYVVNGEGKIVKVNARLIVETFFYNLLHYGGRARPRKPSARGVRGTWWSLRQGWQEKLGEYDSTARQNFQRTWEALSAWASNTEVTPLAWGDDYKKYAKNYEEVASKWLKFIFAIGEEVFIDTPDVLPLLNACRACAYQVVEQWDTFKAVYDNTAGGKASDDDELIRRLFG